MYRLNLKKTKYFKIEFSNIIKSDHMKKIYYRKTNKDFKRSLTYNAIGFSIILININVFVQMIASELWFLHCLFDLLLSNFIYQGHDACNEFYKNAAHIE